MIDKTVLHYRIIEKLGEGGMGVVYRAEDTRLKREIAVKFLPRQFTITDEERQRFKLEAQAAAALNHPNIATIYAVEEFDQDVFITMEYIAGRELRQLISDHQRLSLDDIIDYSVQVASGLQAAHAKGIIHRDIKSSNIMVSDERHVKIMDFGLAKVRGSSQVTRTGAILGTVAYMSPEQIQGKQVDHRTDIWSLGVVLYEMLTGHLPFEGEADQVALYLILTDDPGSISQFREETPQPLEAMVLKMLHKEADKRHQSMQEVVDELKSLRQDSSSGTTKTTLSSPVSPGKRRSFAYAGLSAFVLIAIVFLITFFATGSRAIDSIAVMPLVNVGADSSTEYLSDGITESLISSLSGSANLKVMSRNAVFAYKGREIDAKQVGETLNVKAVLTGQLVQRGTDLRLSLELVDARDNRQLWGKQYNRTSGDILALQEDISNEIYKELKPELSIEQQQGLRQHLTENDEAYQLYLKGRYFWNKWTEEDIKRGIQYFNQAIEKDPGFALAYVGLADCYSGLAFSSMPPTEAVPIARTYIQKALELDDAIADAHFAIADIKYHYDWDWAGTEAELNRVLELNPNHALAYELYGRYLMSMGRSDEGVARLEQALAVDPLAHLTNCYLAMVYYSSRKYDQAIMQAEKTLEMESYCPFEYLWIGGSYIEQGMYQKGLIELEKTRDQSSDWPPTMASLAYGYAVSGDRTEAGNILNDMTALARQRRVDPYLFAVVYAGLGDNDKAFEWLDKAFEERSREIPLLKVEPKLDGLRSDPRFDEFLSKAGLAD